MEIVLWGIIGLIALVGGVGTIACLVAMTGSRYRG